MSDVDNQHNQVSEVEKRAIFEKVLTYKRGMARLRAIQVAYNLDINRTVFGKGYIDNATRDEASIEKVVLELCQSINYFYQNVFFSEDDCNNDHKRVDEKYFNLIVTQYISDLKSIETIVPLYLNDPWTLPRLARMVRVILGVATIELKHNLKTNPKILISEYTNLAGIFCTWKQIAFVNGVVDKIAKSHFGR